jgi:secreted PhoX family phosphatase
MSNDLSTLSTLSAGLQRRQLLKGGLGLAATGLSTFGLSACGDGSSAPAEPTVAPKPVSVVFNQMAAPTSDADRATAFTNATIDITYNDGSKKLAQPLRYNLIYKTGTSLTRPDGSSVLAGGYYLPDGVTPIIDTSGSTAAQYFSDSPDGQSLLTLSNPAVPGISGNTVFLVTQFEYLTANNKQGEVRGDGYMVGGTSNSMYGRLPSQIGIATLDQDKTTGALSVKHYFPVPTAPAHSLWITCAGSLSPWNTHLSSEEYEPDAWLVHNNIAGGVLNQFQAYSQNTFGSTTAANPYHYGHVPEVTVHADGTGTLVKHFCLGRISRELVQVMPDNRTVLMGDDATSGGMFMFIADVEKVLSSGTLYAAKLTQTSATGAADGGAFTIQWVKLGHAASIEIEALANSLKATDIMDVQTVDPTIADPTNTGYTKINFGTGQQWVKFKNTKAGAFLETHRYAAYAGATMEFTKFEGLTLNAKDKKAYIAMSAIKDTMTANGFVSDVIQLKKISAGAVYEISLNGSQTDLSSSAIDSAWVPVSMSVPTALLGEDKATPDTYGNSANIDKIANPDNVKYSQALRTLFIGEDSGMHINNYIWAYNVDSKTLSRIYSAPAGAECTGLQAVDNLNGFSYLMSNFQHPGDWESIHNTLLNAAGSTLNASINTNWGNKNQAAIGYISGLPTLS